MHFELTRSFSEYHENIHHVLTHWGRLTLIWDSSLTTIDYQCWIVVNWTIGNKFKWNPNRKLHIFVQKNAFENVVMELAAILPRPRCVNCGYQWDVLGFLLAVHPLKYVTDNSVCSLCLLCSHNDCHPVPFVASHTPVPFSTFPRSMDRYYIM